MEPADKKSPKSIVILFRYLPRYRLELFEIMRSSINARGLEFLYVTGKPEKRFRLRGDMQEAVYHREVGEVRPRIFGITFRYLFAGKYTRAARTVIYEYSITNVNTWLALFTKKSHEVVIWGHGPGYMAKQSPFRKKMETIQARMADRVLVYTEPAKTRLLELGIENSKIHFLNNTFDWANLQNEKLKITSSDVRNFKSSYDISDAGAVAFIGGLDFEKRIRFIAEVLDFVWEMNPDIKFIFGGKGPDEHLLDKAVERKQAHMLGRVEEREKALIGTACKVLINPGNTGLLAVDALVLGIPILGTDVLSSPEKDYLIEGASHFTLTNNPASFAKEMLDFLSDFPRTSFTPPPTIEEYAARFVNGALGENVA